MGFFSKAATSLEGPPRREQSISPAASYGTIKPGTSSRLPSVDEDALAQQSPGALADFDFDESDDDDDEADGPRSYQSLLLNYTCVPISALLALLVLALLPRLVWPRPVHLPHYPDLFAASCAWIVSFALRIPIHLLSTLFGRYDNNYTAGLSVVVQIFTQESIRLCVFTLLGLRLQDPPAEHPDWIPYPDVEDDAFRRVWWMAFGWAAVETIVAISQSYDQLALYKHVLGGVHSVPTPARQEGETEAELRRRDVDLDEEVQMLISIHDRAELEYLYGVPLPAIPTFVSCLQRIDSILLSFALTLLLSSAYVRAVVSASSLPQPPPSPSDTLRAVLLTLPAFIAIVILHSVLALMWTMALPKIGVHTASYTALLIALGLFFGGLASWGTLD